MKNNTPTSTPAAVAVNANAELVARVAELEAALESIVGLIFSRRCPSLRLPRVLF